VEVSLFTQQSNGFGEEADSVDRKRAERSFTEAPKPKKTKESPKTDDGRHQHRYLQSVIKRIGESYGFVATIEKEVFGGLGKIDVALENGKQRIACEIALTNTVEYELLNLQKCLNSGFDKIVIVSPDTKQLRKIRRKSETILSSEQAAGVHFLEPENFHLFLETLANPDSDFIQNKVKGYEVKTGFKQTSEQELRTRKQVVLDILSNALRRKEKKKDD